MPEGVTITTEDVSRHITKRAASFQNLSGEARVYIQTWEEKYKFSEIVNLEIPDRFRLDTLGAFDQPVVFLTSDGEIILLYIKKKNIVYKGIPTRENLFKLSGINLSVEDTISVLSGNLPRLAFITLEWGMPLPELNQYYLERTSLVQDTIQRIWFDTQYGTISYFEEYRLTDGELTLRVQFDDYRAEAGSSYSIPARVLIDRPLDRTRVEVTYKFFDVNLSLDPTLFDFTPPPDAPIHYLDDTTAEELERLAPYEDFRTTTQEE
jgi:outer membrane lipoprotein-sorting protein